MPSCDVTLIVPVLDDATALDALVRRIRSWRLQPAEIIVSGGAAESAVESICRDWQCRWLVTQPSRGVQLDDGARAAAAATFWFLHADAVPSTDCLAAIVAARARGAQGGYFQFEFTGPRTWQRVVLERLIRWRTRCGGIPYGDQGLWIGRETYSACGGFARDPLFEEVALVKRLRRQTRFEALPQTVGVAARRWESEGWWYRSAANRLLAVSYALGVPATSLATRYYPLRLAPRDSER
jgi:rSAM/selenodomain-associated transferase 2